jgi:hypothetical protein
MTQINPLPNQTTFPITVGLIADPLRIAFFCPSTGLHFDSVYDARFDWTGTGNVSLTLATDSAMAPPGFSSLSAHAQNKPFATIPLTITQDGATAILSRTFPTSTISSVSSFNVWIEGTPSGGSHGILAWTDPTWPVGKSSSGGPGQFAAEQTDYYYMKSLNQTIALTAITDGSVNWLQTQYGAMVGKTMVVSPPLGSSTGQSFALVVSVSDGENPASVTITGTVGTAVTESLGYQVGRESSTLAIHMLAEPAVLVT